MYYYKQVANGGVVSVEAKSKDISSPSFVKATKSEYESYLASLPPSPVPEPSRDLLKEIDELNARLNKAGVD